MAESDFLKYQNLQVSIGGSVPDKRPSSFYLYTCAGFPSVRCRVEFPAETGNEKPIGKAGDDITVSLVQDDKSDLYFTGKIHYADTLNKVRSLFLTDDHQLLCQKTFTAAYRKEKASTILDDILSAAGITEKDVTVPDVEIARFSTKYLSCLRVLDLLVDALRGYGFDGLVYFFDRNNKFHFGTLSDSGKNDDGSFTFTSGEDILEKGELWYKVLPAPIRHSQSVTIDGAAYTTYISELKVSQGVSRLKFYIRSA